MQGQLNLIRRRQASYRRAPCHSWGHGHLRILLFWRWRGGALKNFLTDLGWLFYFSNSFKSHSRTPPPALAGSRSHLAKQSLKLLSDFLALSIASRGQQGQDALLISAWNWWVTKTACLPHTHFLSNLQLAQQSLCALNTLYKKYKTQLTQKKI